ncbi:hypothetical protein H6F93_00165 [Leptolyngbya sp. FACHB-671]|nr:hypothetical protein [Leptolyngbya sp. FACHB-671]
MGTLYIRHLNSTLEPTNTVSPTTQLSGVRGSTPLLTRKILAEAVR